MRLFLIVFTLQLMLLSTHLSASSAESLYQQGQHYRLAEGDQFDPQKAAEAYQQAAVLNHVEAQRQLGAMYYYGQLGEPDYQQAEQWLTQAGESGDAWAQWLLGVMKLNGEGGEVNIAEAEQWFARAQQGGLPQASLALQQIQNDYPGQTVGLEVNMPAAQPLRAVNTSQTAVSVSTAQANYRLQTGAFSRQQYADGQVQALRQLLADKDIDLQVEVDRVKSADGLLYKTFVSSFVSSSEALQMCDVLKQNGQQCFLVHL